MRILKENLYGELHRFAEPVVGSMVESRQVPGIIAKTVLNDPAVARVVKKYERAIDFGSGLVLKEVVESLECDTRQLGNTLKKTLSWLSKDEVVGAFKYLVDNTPSSYHSTLEKYSGVEWREQLLADVVIHTVRRTFEDFYGEARLDPEKPAPPLPGGGYKEFLRTVEKNVDRAMRYVGNEDFVEEARLWEEYDRELAETLAEDAYNE